MFKKKKDQLYEIIDGGRNKQTGEFTNSVINYLDQVSMFNLSLASRKYYILIQPILASLKLDQEDYQSKSKNNKRKKNKKQNSPRESSNLQKNIESIDNQQTQVVINRQPLHKVCAELKTQDWYKIEKLPFINSYLQKKIESGVNFFYQNKKTGKLIFLNRSLVDPKLNYEMGGFDQDYENQAKADIYAEMFKGDIDQIDFTSQQALISRQKRILKTIEIKKQEIKQAEEINYDKQLSSSALLKKIAVILCFGGSFSLGIFQGPKCILHKSDKKYVCRKKAGQRQLNRDKQSGSQIKSMGSQIRRDQQKKHQANVYEILTDNRQAIQSCDLVFLQAPGLNRLFIINDNQTLSGVKNRLRSLCVTAKKANYTEVEALYAEITKIAFVELK